MRTVRKLRAAFSTRVARTGSYRAIKATEASACLFETTIQGVSPSNRTFAGSVGDPIVNTIICPV